MSTFDKRLQDELSELNQKIDKLDSFLNSDKVNKIEEHQKSLLQIQAFAMKTYSKVLSERISLLLK